MDTPGNLVTNGPFVLGEWSLNRHLRFRRNPLLERGRDRAGDGRRAGRRQHQRQLQPLHERGARLGRLRRDPALHRAGTQAAPDFHPPHSFDLFLSVQRDAAPVRRRPGAEGLRALREREDITRYVLGRGRSRPGASSPRECRVTGRRASPGATWRRPGGCWRRRGIRRGRASRRSSFCSTPRRRTSRSPRCCSRSGRKRWASTSSW